MPLEEEGEGGGGFMLPGPTLPEVWTFKMKSGMTRTCQDNNMTSRNVAKFNFSIVNNNF